MSRSRVAHLTRASIVLLAVALTMTGCTMQPAGITKYKLEHGTKLAHEVVDDAAARVPAKLSKDSRYASIDDAVSCDGGVKHGSQATTSWDYGFAQRLAAPTSNGQLLKLLSPQGTEWKKTSDEPIVTDGHTDGREVQWDSALVRYVVSLFGEGDDPRFALSGTTACFNNEVSGIAAG
jgi:hypothetical protein